MGPVLRFHPLDRPLIEAGGERLGIEPDAFVVGIVARVQWRRRFDVFIEAIDRARKKLPNLTALIVGRGGQMILRDWPNALHVRLYAPAEVRSHRIMAREGISEAAALRLIKQSDEHKRQFIRQMFRSNYMAEPVGVIHVSGIAQCKCLGEELPGAVIDVEVRYPICV